MSDGTRGGSTRRPGDSREPVGSVGEEVRKLLSASRHWAGDSGDEYADASATVAAEAASTWRRLNEHVATGGEDCRYCPLCRAMSVVRRTSPEVRAHLLTAASSLLQAAGELLAATQDLGGAQQQPDVENSELSDEGEED